MAIKDQTHSITSTSIPSGGNRSRFSFPPLDKMFVYAALTVLAIIFCAPFVWLVLTSLKPADEIFSANWIPSEWRWDNYGDVFDVAPVMRWMWNTFVITALAVVAVVLSSSLVAYGFARIRFRGRGALFALVMGTYLLPGAVTMIPTFLIWNELGAVNTFWPLWAGNLFGSAFYIFMLRQFLLTIPQDLVDSARIDGAGFLRIYWNLMLPLIRPAVLHRIKLGELEPEDASA